MRLSRALVAGLGGLLVAGVVPGAATRDGASGEPAFASPGGGVPASTTSCVHRRATHAVRRPRFVRHIATGETGWFSSPGLVDLNGDGRLEIVAPFYSTFVFNAKGHELGRGTATAGRVYAPSVVADLDGDGRPEIVVGGTGSVAAYDL
ncbi:MAG: VCBS repeat-containing protein, partial [Nocardioides sp.]